MDKNENQKTVSPLGWILISCVILLLTFLYFHQDLLYTKPPYLTIVLLGSLWILEMYRTICDFFKFLRDWRIYRQTHGDFRKLLWENRSIFADVLRIAMYVLATLTFYDSYVIRHGG